MAQRYYSCGRRTNWDLMVQIFLFSTLTMLTFSAATLADIHHKCYGGGCVGVSLNEVGGKEIRIAYKDFLVLETEVQKDNQTGFVSREISNGKRVIKILYDIGKNIIDCDIYESTRAIHKFWRTFFNKKAKQENMPRRIRQWLKKEHVVKFHKEEFLSQHKDQIHMHDMKQMCALFKRKVEDQVKLDVTSSLQKGKEEENGEGKSRKKRDLLIHPGTKWCGKGNSADHHDDLGEDRETDMCCRDHDHCPYTIGGFSRNYHLFNYRFYTLSHCECDERFLRCLKKTDSPLAKRIGYIFFQMVSSKCFVFRPQRVCDSREWWGKCKKFATQYGAALKGPLRF